MTFDADRHRPHYAVSDENAVRLRAEARAEHARSLSTAWRKRDPISQWGREPAHWNDGNEPAPPALERPEPAPAGSPAEAREEAYARYKHDLSRAYLQVAPPAT